MAVAVATPSVRARACATVPISQGAARLGPEKGEVVMQGSCGQLVELVRVLLSVSLEGLNKGVAASGRAHTEEGTQGIVRQGRI